MRSHEDNEATIEQVCAVLEKSNVEYQKEYRALKRSVVGFDLVITIGGDGTLLDASHAVNDIPMLGINSSPAYSVGHFCVANRENFAFYLEQVLSGEMDELSLTRMRIQIGERTLPYPVLNEILFAHAIPASTSRYVLAADGSEEYHKGSGIWIATAAGSTAAIYSAGGKILPHDSTKMQYVVREPYIRDGDSLSMVQGITNGPIQLTSQIRRGVVYLDGHRQKFNVGFGQVISLSNDAPPLRIYWDSTRTPRPGRV